MDTRLLQYYERELRSLRELGAELARHFPKVAGRLAQSELNQADPYVERLLEGFAFMAARVHLKLDAEFPRFSRHLMELVYPHYMAPTPSMAIAQLQPDTRGRGLEEGYRVPRGTALYAHTPLRDVTACEYRTAHDVELWPIEIESAEYTSSLRDIAALSSRIQAPVKALLRLRLRCADGMRFDRLSIERLPIFLRGGDEISARLYEQLITSACGLWMRWGPHAVRDVATSTAAEPVSGQGFVDGQALLPVSARTFQGYRLLQEYFAFPCRFDFVELSGLLQGVTRCSSDRMELLLPLTRFDATLEGAIDTGRLSLFATPVINLFPRACDRLPMQARNHELHVVPDRTRPLDFEVHSVTRVAVHGCVSGSERVFTSMNAVRQRADQNSTAAHYSMERRARVVSAQQRRYGSRTPYVGSEVFLTLSDPSGEALLEHEPRQLGVHALCSNRDLPLLLGLGRGGNDFTFRSEAPIGAVRCITGPTAPRSLPLDMNNDSAWRLVSHLSTNYLSLAEQEAGADRLRELLVLYAQLGDPLLQRQVEGLRGICAAPARRLHTGPGPRTSVRGLEVSLSFEERAFSGHGVFTLASVLAAFFAKHAAINSFTETVLTTEERGEVYRWPMMADLRHAS